MPHGLPFGQQPSNLFDIAIPWAERVVAGDSMIAEFTGYIPSLLQPQHSRACYSRYGYTSEGHIVRYDDPRDLQLHPNNGMAYLCGVTRPHLPRPSSVCQRLSVDKDYLCYLYY